MKKQIFERERVKTFDWAKVWYENERLKEYLVKELDYDEREHEIRLTGIRLVKEYIKNLKPSQYRSTR
jgi:hypothetical protein